MTAIALISFLAGWCAGRALAHRRRAAADVLDVARAVRRPEAREELARALKGERR